MAKKLSWYSQLHHTLCFYDNHATLAFIILTVFKGFSVLSVLSLLIEQTVSIPLITLPNIVCLLSSQGQAITVRKNCEPFVFGPRFAIAKQ